MKRGTVMRERRALLSDPSCKLNANARSARFIQIEQWRFPQVWSSLPIRWEGAPIHSSRPEYYRTQYLNHLAVSGIATLSVGGKGVMDGPACRESVR
jgi:hypothetical protein